MFAWMTYRESSRSTAVAGRPKVGASATRRSFVVAAIIEAAEEMNILTDDEFMLHAYGHVEVWPRTLQPGVREIVQECGAEPHPVLRVASADASPDLRDLQEKVGADPVALTNARERLRVQRSSRSSKQ